MPSDPPLTSGEIAAAAAVSGLKPLADGVAEQFSVYSELLVRWNAKLNLTAILSPRYILQRHFIECIFAAQNLAGSPATLLDFGSGAGFPGVPISLCRREIAVTLGESNGKKAAFLREVVRVLGLTAEVFPGRVEQLPEMRTFNTVAMRAVDKMGDAVPAAASRVRAGGGLAILTTQSAEVPGFTVRSSLPLPGSENGIFLQLERQV